MTMPKLNSYQMLILLAFVFLLPSCFSWFFYSFAKNLHLVTNQHGTLLNPVVPIENLLGEDKLWQIIFVPKHCIASQDNKLFDNLRQMRLLLGAKKNRTILKLVVPLPCLKEKIKDFKTTVMTEKEAKKITYLFKKHHMAFHRNKIYLMDPLGNVFMSYPSSVAVMDIYKDFKKVLDISQIG